MTNPMKAHAPFDSSPLMRRNGFQVFLTRLFAQKILLLMSIPFVVHILIFRYVPIFGWVMGFQNYKPGRSMLDQEWVGLKHFQEFLFDPAFPRILRNTLAMSVISLVLGTVFAILIAIFLYETKNRFFRRSVQTISYLPYFISWVAAANIVLEVTSPTGVLNKVLLFLNVIDQPVLWMGIPELFWWNLGWANVWKTAGFGAIVYLAAMTGIDPQLYEAASMDGANRVQRIMHVTIPGILPTIMVLLIINTGNLLTSGFEQQYLLQNTLVTDYSVVFTIYVLNYGLRLQRFSFAAAAGIFQSVVSVILVLSANKLSEKFEQETLI